MAVLGNNIYIFRENSSHNWEIVAATKSDEIQADCDLIEIAGSSDQTWKKHIAGRKSWSVNVSWLVSAVSDIKKVLQVGDRVQLRIGEKTYAQGGSGQGLNGYAIVKTCKVTMTRGALANGSFQFVGDGALSPNT
jgi:predicted secreted protein